MHMDIDTLGSPSQCWFREYITKDPTKNDSPSDFNNDTHVFDIAPIDTVQYADSSRPNHNRLIGTAPSIRAGGSERINPSNQYIKINDNNVGAFDNSNKIFKRKLDFNDEQTEEMWKPDVPPAKRVSSILNTNKRRTFERKRIRRLTVCKLQNIEDIENSLWKYLLVHNILLRLCKDENLKKNKCP